MKLIRLLVVVALVAGCSDASPVPAPTAPTPLQEAFVLGCVECGPKETFGVITDVSWTDRGSILLLDQSEPRIREFDSSGGLIRSWGVDGEGPGEFGTTRFFLSEPDGSVIGLEAYRWPRFDSLGVFVGASEPAEPIVPYDVSPDPLTGGATATGLRLAHPGQMREPAVIFLSPGGSVQIRSLPGVLGSDLFGSIVVASAPGPEGTWVAAYNREYRLAVMRGDDLVRELELSVPMEPLSEEEKERLRATAAADPNIDPNTPVPEFSSLLTSIRQSDDGTLWVRSTRGDGETIFDLFDLEAGYVRSVSVPVPVRDYDPRADGLLVLWYDELGVSKVSMFRASSSDP